MLPSGASPRSTRRGAGKLIALGLAAALVSSPLAAMPALADDSVETAVAEVDAAALAEAPAAEPAEAPAEAAPAPAAAPALAEPVAEKPAAEPVAAPAEEPAADEPAAEEPADEESAEEPAAEEPAAEEPAAEEPAAHDNDQPATSARTVKRGEAGSTAALEEAPAPSVTNLVSTVSGYNVQLSWDAASNDAVFTAYMVQYSENGVDFYNYAQVDRSQTSYDTYHNPGYYYFFRVTTYSYSYATYYTEVYGQPSNVVEPSSEVISSRPLNVTVSGAPRAVVIEWDAPQFEAPGNEFVVAYHCSGDWYWRYSEPMTELSYTIANVTPGNWCIAYVYSRGGGFDGPWTGPGHQAFATNGPSALSTVEAVAGDEDVSISWVPVAGEAVDGYIVRYREVGTFTWTTLAETTSTEAVVPGLDNGTEYQFQVAARDSQGTSTWSAAITATPIGAPGVVTNFSYVPTDGGAVLNWDAPENDGGSDIHHYNIYVAIDGSDNVSVSTDGAATAYTVDGLENGQTYDVRIAAVSSITGLAENVGTITPGIAPSGPVDPWLRSHSESVDVTWEAPSFVGASAIDHFEVQWAPVSDVSRPSWNTVEVDGLTTTITGLTNSVLYAVQVRAVNSDAASDWVSAGTVYPFTFAPTFERRDGSSIAGTTLKANDVIVVSGSGSLPGETVQVELHSDPIELGSTVVAADGTFSVEVAIPADVPAGSHEVYAYMAGGGFLIADAEVTVTIAAAAVADADEDDAAPAVVPAADGGSLAITGVNDSQLAGGIFAAVLLLLTGAGLIVVRRRSASTE